MPTAAKTQYNQSSTSLTSVYSAASTCCSLHEMILLGDDEGLHQGFLIVKKKHKYIIYVSYELRNHQNQ